MSLTAAASGFIVLLLSVSVVQGQDVWRVTYSTLQICASKGSTVEMNCTFSYPEMINGEANTLQETFWFKEDGRHSNDVQSVSEHSGRVKNICDGNKCTLRITNLRETDSAEYRFRIITNKDRYSGSPGVTLSVTGSDLQVKVSGPPEALRFQCLSRSPVVTSYIWFRNGQKLKQSTSSYYSPEQLLHTDSYSCAVRRHEKCPSPPVYAPKLLSVSVRPFGEIRENSSVTLTCSSDANPAATYTWFKKNNYQPLSRKAQLVFSSIKSSDSGEFSCKAENELRKPTYKWISIDVKYPPKLPSVSVSPSAEIVEGSSVTLTCSSDANPAAKYTWFKENGPLNLHPSNAGAQLVFSSINSSASGEYYCVAENTLGRTTSKLISINVKWGGELAAVVAGTITVVLLVMVFLSVLLWIRQKRASTEPSEAEERQEHPEQEQPEEQEDLQYATIHFSKTQDHLYSNTRPARPPRRTEQHDVTEYAAVKFTSNSTAMRTRSKEPEEDPAALYSTVNNSR